MRVAFFPFSLAHPVVLEGSFSEVECTGILRLIVMSAKVLASKFSDVDMNDVIWSTELIFLNLYTLKFIILGMIVIIKTSSQ